MRRLFAVLVLALAGAAVAAGGQGREMTVAGSSMAPTLSPGQKVWVDPGTYAEHAPARGDLVALAFKTRARLMVKRVVALPGDRLEIRDGRLWRDGRPLEEPYLAAPRVLAAKAARLLALQLSRNGGRVPAGHVVVLGDNTAGSFDSGDYGFVSLDQIVGRVTP
ncbi:MAG: signal peptidase I [Rhodospirillales bacterium]|nr:signal peptidase I [Rhodospirillales bacterium]MDH3912548.1 signal peptidase I [Rhodospirillales bacterium]